MLGLNGSTTDPLVVKAGVEMARAHQTELVALHIVEVDWRHDLDEEIPGSRELASTVLDLAEGAAEQGAPEDGDRAAPGAGRGRRARR